MSISDCTVGEGNFAHFFRYFFLKPNDPLTQWLGEDRKLTKSVSQIWPSTEYATNLTEFVEVWPSVRIFSPSSRSRYYISHQVFCRKLTESPSPLPSTESTTVHRVTGLPTEWLFFSPSVWSETHRVTSLCFYFIVSCLYLSYLSYILVFMKYHEPKIGTNVLQDIFDMKSTASSIKPR